MCTIIYSFTAQCPALARIPNGAIEYLFGTHFDIGTVARYSCDPGFRLVGIEILQCLISVTWSDQPPVCERKIHL